MKTTVSLDMRYICSHFVPDRKGGAMRKRHFGRCRTFQSRAGCLEASGLRLFHRKPCSVPLSIGTMPLA